MSKYIIEIEEKPLCVFDKDTQTYFPRLWRVKGFNSLVLDEDGLSRLEELNSDYINEHYSSLQDDAYQRGLNDAWEAARKIVCDESFDWNTLLHIFDSRSFEIIFRNFSASEAVAKLKAYEEKQDDKIEVGDEVKWHSNVVVVTRLYKDGVLDWCDGISKDGRAFHVLAENVRKTGRHFDIASILEDMRE